MGIEQRIIELEDRNEVLRTRLLEAQREREKYKEALRIVCLAIRNECAGVGCDGMWRVVRKQMADQGYDIDGEDTVEMFELIRK